MGAMWIGLGNFLASLFGKSMGFFVAHWNGKIIFKTAQLALMLAMLTTLYLSVTALIGSIIMTLPDALTIPMSWVAPSNINLLITTYISFRIALALYRWKHTQIKQVY